jgi:hypothetical protein
MFRARPRGARATADSRDDFDARATTADEGEAHRRLGQQQLSSWDAAERGAVAGADYLYELGRQSSSVSTEVGGRALPLSASLFTFHSQHSRTTLGGSTADEYLYRTTDLTQSLTPDPNRENPTRREERHGRRRFRWHGQLTLQPGCRFRPRVGRTTLFGGEGSPRHLPLTTPDCILAFYHPHVYATLTLLLLEQPCCLFHLLPLGCDTSTILAP